MHFRSVLENMTQSQSSRASRTIKSMVNLSLPSEFSAINVYSPASLFCKETRITVLFVLASVSGKT